MDGAEYRIVQDNSQWPFWFLNDLKDAAGNAVDARIFTRGREAPIRENYSLNIKEDHPPIDICFATFDLIVVSSRIGAVFERLCGPDVSRYPVTIHGSKEQCEILYIRRFVDGIDPDKTEHLTYWGPNDGRPDKLGQIRMLVGLRTKPNCLGKGNIARLEGWPLSVICSDQLRVALIDAQASGVKFEEVSSR